MKMNVLLIVVGIVMIAVGVGMSISGKNKENPSQHVDNSSVTADPAPARAAVPTAAESKPVPRTVIEHESVPTEEKKGDSKAIGNDFEDYVANIFHKQGLRIREWNKGSVTDAGAFAENALNPDMFILDDSGDRKLEYWIECKFRSSIPSTGFELKEYQLNRYADAQRDSKRKILVALGVGGSPKSPDSFYLIPLDSLKRFKHIPDKYLTNYIVPSPEANLKKYIRNYFFNDVFKKSK